MSAIITKQYASPNAATTDIFDVLLKMDAGRSVELFPGVFIEQPGDALSFRINENPSLFPIYDAVKKIKHLLSFVELSPCQNM